MKISYNWLKEYIKTDSTPQQIADILIDLGLEVEGIEEWYSIPGGLENMIIGHVVECSKHPNADKLSITKVDVGTGQLLNIVCGAPNVATGQKVIVALEGAKIFSGQDCFEIKRTKIRGETSEGMICAEDEIGIGTSHDGIIVLESNAKVGTPAKEYFKVEKDWVFEIGLTPNRIDSASHYGVARDLAAYFSLNSPIKAIKSDVSKFKIDNNTSEIEVKVENTEACLRYSGLLIKGVKVKESPQWLQNKLKAIGLRPINNIVDITNFVLHEIGQPLHAFDYSKIKGKKVIVKTLPEGTSFITLDEVERKLSSEDLMICNESEGMCIAGVFGGKDSGITDSTTDVFLESACFSPVWIRKTSKRHDLHTDSSFRFERGTDPNGTIYALKRAALLIKDLAGGIISSEIIDIYPKSIEKHQIKVTWDGIFSLIGQNLNQDVVKTILKSLEFEISDEDSKGMLLKVPTYRVEVRLQADVVEEILRIYGYNKIDIPNKINATLNHFSIPEADVVEQDFSKTLVGMGFYEIINNSLTKSAYYEQFDEYKDNIVFIKNPLSSELNCLRQTLIYGALESIKRNISYKNDDLKFFEFGNCYFYRKIENPKNLLDQYSENQHLCLSITGNIERQNWITPENNSNFFHLKGYVRNIIEKAGIKFDKLFSEVENHPILMPCIKYYIGKKWLMNIGEIKSNILKEFDIKQAVYVAELNWDILLESVGYKKYQFKELPKFPEVRRDLSMILDLNITYDQLLKVALKTEKNLIKSVNLFDVYQGDRIEKGKKSYALSFTLQSEEKTLTENEINSVMERLMNAFEKELNAKIRA